MSYIQIPLFLKVGSHLKTPKFPIWVVCSESHFSVLFCPSEDLATDHCKEEEFDLYYYDGLANQQEPIRLTVCESHTHKKNTACFIRRI